MHDETVPCTGPIVRLSENRCVNIGFWADMTERPELEPDDRLFAKPIGRRQGCQHTERTNTAAAIKSER